MEHVCYICKQKLVHNVTTDSHNQRVQCDRCKKIVKNEPLAKHEHKIHVLGKLEGHAKCMAKYDKCCKECENSHSYKCYWSDCKNRTLKCYLCTGKWTDEYCEECK